MPLRPLDVTYQLTHLPLRPSTLKKFLQRGFTNTNEIEKCRRSGIQILAAELDVTTAEASDYLREVHGCISLTMTTPTMQQTTTTTSQYFSNGGTGNNFGNSTSVLFTSKTASEMLSAANGSGSAQTKGIITFCRGIDCMLDGGISLGEVTEISGPPGIGKTQLAMQLSVDARLPHEHGGVQGETVFLDTEGNFSPERCYHMAAALVDHVTKCTERKRSQSSRHRPPPVPQWFTPETILSGIHLFRAHDEAAQTAIIKELSAFLKQRQDENNHPIKLIVIDSIAFHYRCSQPGEKYMARTRSLINMASNLAHIAKTFEVAVVCFNQMTTKIDEVTESSRLEPALGESWAHATSTRLVLSHFSPAMNIDNPGARLCTLKKSPHRPPGEALFCVGESGVRGVDSLSDRGGQSISTGDPFKRLRSH